MSLEDKRDLDENGVPLKEEYFSEGGLLEFVEHIDELSGRDVLVKPPVHVSGEQDQVVVEVAFQYNRSYRETLRSYVNNINTIEGGTHVNGFRRAITHVLKKYGDNSDMFTKAKVSVSSEDFREGLTVVSVKACPQFKGQTKGELAI